MNIEEMKRDLSPEEFRTLSVRTSMFSDGVLKDVSEEQLQRYLASPSRSKKQLSKYMKYMYISNGNVYQMYELMRSLPDFEYRIKSLKVTKNHSKYITECRRVLKATNYKEVAREAMMQLVSEGTVCGVILDNIIGNKNTPRVVIFPDLEYFFPGRKHPNTSKYTVWCDLSFFDCAYVSDDFKMDLLASLNPYITIKDYEKYKDFGEAYRYIELPPSRSIVLRVNTLSGSQRFGIPFGVQSLLPLKHKQKLQNMEKVVANKIMNSVAVLTIGEKGSEKTSYKGLGDTFAKSIFRSVKSGLQNDGSTDLSVIGIPEFCELEFPSLDPSGSLDPEKFETIKEDVSTSTGVADGLLTGKNSSYAVLKLNLDLMYNRIGIILEQFENEIFNKLLNIILPKSVGEYYYLEFNKQTPLTAAERLTYLKQLSDKGFSVKYLLDGLGIDAEEYFEQSIYEIEELKLREKIIPPLNTYTTSSGNGVVASSEMSSNENTENTNENNGNDTPRANV